MAGDQPQASHKGPTKQGKGGTAAAATKLVELAGGVVVGLGFVIELEELAGRAKIDGYHAISRAM